MTPGPGLQLNLSAGIAAASCSNFDADVLNCSISSAREPGGALWAATDPLNPSTRTAAGMSEASERMAAVWRMRFLPKENGAPQYGAPMVSHARAGTWLPREVSAVGPSGSGH